MVAQRYNKYIVTTFLILLYIEEEVGLGCGKLYWLILHLL